MLLAKYQDIVFEVEKLTDLPAYHLNHNKRYYGTVYLDTEIISIPVVEGDSLDTCQFMRHQMMGKFELINYDIVTKEWLKEMMDKHQIKVNTIAHITGTNQTTIYRILSGHLNISGPVKSSLFNFFY